MNPDRRDAIKLLGATAGAVVLGAAAQESARAANPRPPRIKIGQIGVAHAHASKLGVFRKSDDFEVVGIVEVDEPLRQRASSQEEFRDLPWMSQEQLLAVPGLQAVLVETRVRDLLGTAEACIGAGKHIHLDKPAGESFPQLCRILDRAATERLVVQMGYMYRYNPGIVLLRDLLKRGWLGEPFEVDAVMSKVVSPDARRGLAEYPGGIMFELGCHITDLVVGILGPPDRVTPFARHSAAVNDGLLDNMTAVLEYPKAVATVRSTALEVEGGERRRLTVCGTEGTFHLQPLDDPAARLALSAPRGSYKRGYQDIAFPKYTRYVDDAADFARTIRGESPPLFSYAHDRAVQKTLLEACGLPINA